MTEGCRRSSFIARCPSFVARRPSFVARRPLLVLIPSFARYCSPLLIAHCFVARLFFAHVPSSLLLIVACRSWLIA